MKVDMVMPQMGESIAEATISKWLKKVGDAVEKDQVILEISTDKVDSEIPAPASGVITELLFNEGDVVPVKTKIATIDSAAAAGTSISSAASAPAPSPSSAATNGSSTNGTPAPTERPAPQIASASSSSSCGASMSAGSAGGASSRFFSPLVMSLAEKHSISLSELDSIAGSGEAGRVNKKDILSYVERRGSGAPASSARAPAPTQASAPTAGTAPASSSSKSGGIPSLDWSADGTKVVPMDTMRQAIADHMVRSKQTSPHVYSMQEIDMTAVSKWRKAHQSEFLKAEGFKLSFTPFFLEAAVRCLLKFPYINCSLDGKKIILKKNINLGCAVAIGDPEKGYGLIVPVIKRAEERNLVGLARSLNELALKARTKKLLPDDVSGGTFTITNPGVFGTIIGTPIINQPQVAILCLGAIVKRPVVIDDMIAIREMCYLTLSYDHRIVDGALGGSFLAAVRDYLEQWDPNRPLY